MGMFDYIKCEVPLPDGYEPKGGQFQSKDFDCEMVEHIITKDGRLMLDRGHNEVVPVMERRMWKPEWGDSEAAQKEHGLEAACGCMRRVPKYEDANFHGLVNFYDLETTGYEPADNWPNGRRPIYKSHDYNAKFTDGQLVGIELMADDNR